jgi:mannosyltransferase
MLTFLIQHSPLLYFTQSLWRDEAFSILVSERSPLWFLTRTFEPPLYYVLLHYWMKFFGQGEISVRMLSVVGFALATVIVIHWGEQLFRKHWLSWYLPVFFFFNPTLLYYAFEVRTYAWYVLFAVISFYAYTNKKWKLLAAATILGLYTHSYMIFVPFTQFFHYCIMNRNIFRPKKLLGLHHDPFLRALFASILAFTPWLYQFVTQAGQLKHSWYFPVDFHLIRSVLGNLFLGYEGTPGYIWDYSTLLSVVLLGFFIFAVHTRRLFAKNGFYFLMILVPLFVVIGISFIKPLYVNRYVIPVTIAEVFLLVFALEQIRRPVIQKILAIIFMVFVIGFNSWYPAKHAKLDIRSTLLQVNALMSKNDVIYAESPLIFFETIYYSKDRSKVFLYNPDRYPFPWYVGGIVVSPRQMMSDLPAYPVRAFLIKGDGSYEMRYNTPVTATRMK